MNDCSPGMEPETTIVKDESLGRHTSQADIQSVMSNQVLLRKHLFKLHGNRRLIHHGNWKNSVAEYSSLREFLKAWGEGQLPSETTNTATDSTITAQQSENGHNSVQLSNTAGKQSATPNKASTPETVRGAPNVASGFPFQDMEVVLEESTMPISVVKFARQSCHLLAVGDEAGQVRIVAVRDSAQVIQILEHRDGVADLDWSVSNTCIVTCCEDGMVVLWGVAEEGGIWKCLRTLSTHGSATCCRFHAVNQNLVLVGTALGVVHAINASTGVTVSKYALKTSSSEGVFASAMDCSGAYAFVGDSRGHLVVLDCDITNSPTGPSLALVWRSQPPTRERVPVLSVQHSPPTEMGAESTVLTYQADGCACLWSFTTSGSRGPRFLRKLKVMVPAPSPYTNATFCPTSGTQSVDLIALGCLHPGVTVYNLSKVGRDMAPAAVVQLQGHLSPVVALTYSHNAQILAAGDVEGSLIIWRNG